jgi:gliding motility-associated-like protein
MRTQLFIFLAILFISGVGYSQPCTTIGQTPSTAFRVCGTTTFFEHTPPRCQNNNLFVPGCPESVSTEPDRNPFWYQFTCFTSGTLGFLIFPHDKEQDFDWQLFDITGHNPDDVYTDTSLTVAGNWAGSYGETGASGFGAPYIVCPSSFEIFSEMPNLVKDHEYLLLVSHFTDGENGYTLSFDGGTAAITGTSQPHLQTAKAGCDSKKITLKLDRKVKCSSLTATGSEFSLSPAGATIVSATANNCSNAFYFDEVTLTLANTLTNGNYQLIINNGDDGNTLLDDCDRSVPLGEKVAFLYRISEPIFADSIGSPGCSPTAIKIYFPKRIDCSTVAADGSDFIVSGPSPVIVVSAAGDCASGLSGVVTVLFSAPIYTKGNYTLTLKAGTDGTTINDECDLEMPKQTLMFRTEDTVSAAFSYNNQPGCRFNTLTFSHDGAHDVNAWNWIFNNSTTATIQTHTITFPASSTNDAQLIVTNGTCSDTVNNKVTMNNQVKADFEMPAVICPEDPIIVANTSTGLIDTWQWNFGNIGSSGLKDPAPQYFPQNNVQSDYTIKLRVSNNTLSCSDSISKTLRVLNNCFIAVPSAFTPNNDGLNDFLYPTNAQKATDLEFKVFNRWGQLVFFTRNWQKKWDGKVNGKQQQPGIFVWYLKYTYSVTGQKIFQKGTTMLIR